MSTPTPTPEQAAVVDAYATGKDLVIEAGAGTGKTSTLRMLAEAAPSRRGVYVAYNRAIAADARRSFPSNVHCATAHSLAFRAVGRGYAHRLDGPRMPARATAKALGITGPLRVSPEKVLSYTQVARIVMGTVDYFCRSADDQVGPWHVPVTAGLDDPDTLATLRAAVVPLARKAWADLVSPDGKLKFSHDHYLKIWALSYPVLPADVVLFDEAQDADPLIASIVARQDHAQRVMVGDRCQQLYAWRGARDAMTGFDGVRLPLTQSFRFGPAVADQANTWLGILDAPLRLTGTDAVASTVETVARPDVVLCRTNAEAVAQVMAAADQGWSVALVGGGVEIRRLAEAAADLKAGRGTVHPELFAFTSWREVQEYVDQDAAGSDLRTFVKLIDAHGPDAVIDITSRLVDERAADVTVSTAHKAKGREWDSVRIAPDFPEPRKDDDGVPGDIPRPEAMLAYVAVTRARHVLDRAGLAWVDRWLAERGQA